MPGRIVPLIFGQLYHVFNRGIDHRPTFTDKREYQRANESISYYRLRNLPISLSKYLRLDKERKLEMSKLLVKSEKLVEIHSYCFMPNHFHFLLKQVFDNGISKFLSNFQNGYTRYFNTKHKRDGSLFLDQFKAVRIESDEQLVHVSRYIHLNPYTGYVIKRVEDLLSYEWSSFKEYLTQNEGNITEKTLILGFFPSREKYKRFILNQADYQKRLKEIEHLIFE